MSVKLILRLLIGAIILVIALLGALRVQQYAQSTSYLEGVASRNIETLQTVRLVEDVMSDLSRLSVRIRLSRDPAALSGMHEILSLRMAAARDALAERDLGRDEAELQENLKLLDEFQSAARAALLARQTRMTAEGELADRLAAIGTARLAASEEVRVLRLGALGRLGDTTAEVSSLLRARMKATEDMSMFLSKIESLTLNVEAGYLGRVDMDLSDDIEDISALLEQSETDAALDGVREDVGTLIRELGEAGHLVALVHEARMSARSAETATELLTARLSSVSQDISGILVRASARSSEFGGAFDAMQKRVLLAEILLTTMALLLVLALAFVVVERWILKRLDVLRSDVTNLAKGKMEILSSMPGRDELGQMASALRVLRGMAVDLHRSNRELSDFAYVASHDLRSPLRAIQDVVDWTVEDYGAVLPDGVMQNLSLVRGRSDKLSQLLADLLDYARAGRGTGEIARLRIPELLDEIDRLLNLRPAFELTFSGVSDVCVERLPFRTILLNLIGNAHRHHDRAEGQISVTSEVRKGWLTLKVQDDGPGIAKRHQAKVFELFQRLADEPDPKGSGIGLSMVRKLAEAMGGTVTLSSDGEAERGSVFTLIIPLAGQDEADTTAVVSNGEMANGEV